MFRLTIRRFDNDTFTGQQRDDFMVHECMYIVNNYNVGIKRQHVLTASLTALEVEWLWWNGQKTLTLLSEDKLVEKYLLSKLIEIEAVAKHCITDYCVAVGRLIYSQFANKPTRSKRSADPKESFDQSEKQRLISDSADYCPYESKIRNVLKIGDKRYDDEYTYEDYMDECIVT